MNAPEPAQRSKPLPSDSLVRRQHFASAEPPVVPDYELIRRIGGGSYGEVWLARSTTGALRALKIVWRHTFDDERPFQREFEGIQRFERISREHPSQLALFHIGRGEGYFFYVMELADAGEPQSDQCSVGQYSVSHAPSAAPITASQLNTDLLITEYSPRTLRSLLRPNTQLSTLNSQPSTARLPAARVLEIGLALTEALAHLHTHGLVHRDVKPSNVIFVNGRPKLADIGLVTDTGDTRSIVGTEGYLAPEGPGTPQADLFALGKVLYEALTGLDRRQLPQLPPDLRGWPDAQLVFELNEVILKACETDQRQRYPSAREMASDLGLLQRGESVKARRSTRQRIVLFSRIGFGAALLAFVLAGAWFLSTNVTWRKPTSTERQATPAQRQEAQRLYSSALKYPKSTMAGLNRRFELLNAAINADPDFAQAHAELAQTYLESSEVLLPPKHAMTEARKNALRALELYDSLALAHNALAGVLAYDDLNGTKAEAEYKRAIAADPRFVLAYGNYASLLMGRGRLDDAERVLKAADQIEPNAQIILVAWCWRYYAGRRFEDELRQANRLLDLFPDNTAGLMHRAWAQERLGFLDEALATAQRMKQLDPAPDFVAFLGFVHGRMGHQGDAQKALEELRLMSASRRVSGIYPAQVLLGLGDKDGAIEHLQRAVEDYPAMVLGLKANPLWDAVREDPRFTALLGQLSKSWKPSPEAKKLYDEGWAHLRKQTKDGFAQGISCFNRAIELDANYAMAYCGLGDAHWQTSEFIVPPVQALAEMRNKARRALEIDDSLPDAHTYLGLALFFAFDIAGGELELKRAVELGPNNPSTLNFYAVLLRCTGRLTAAGELQAKARQLDPSNPAWLVWECRQLCAERQFDAALQMAEKHAQINSNSIMTPIVFGEVYTALERFEEAAIELKKVRAMDDDPGMIASLGYVYGRLGRTNEARTALQELEYLGGNRYIPAYGKALVDVGMGETKEALRELELAFAEGSPTLVGLNIDQRWSPLRGERRFAELLKKVGLEN